MIVNLRGSLQKVMKMCYNGKNRNGRILEEDINLNGINNMKEISDQVFSISY
jgi:hypothetical protein